MTKFKPVSLAVYVKQLGKGGKKIVAEQAGLTEPAIHHCINNGRNITVHPGRGNQVVLHETKILKRRTG